MLSPPAGGADITLSTWSTPPESASLSIGCTNIEATYDELVARGVAPDNRVSDAEWGRWFGITDPDGNSWLVVEQR